MGKSLTRKEIAAEARARGWRWPQTVVCRVAKGWPLERALATPSRRGEHSIGARARARAAGCERSTVYARMKRGWSENDAIELPPVLKIPRSTNPKAIASRKQRAETVFIASTLLGRNVCIEEAKQLMQSFRLAGIEVSSLAQRARNAGLPLGVVYTRINKHGWSEERALSTPLRKDRSTWHRVQRSAIRQQSGVAVATALSRIRKGWPEQLALTAPVHYRYHVNENSIAERARKAGMSPSLIKSRLREGWSWERAISGGPSQKHARVPR